MQWSRVTRRLIPRISRHLARHLAAFVVAFGALTAHTLSEGEALAGPKRGAPKASERVESSARKKGDPDASSDSVRRVRSGAHIEVLARDLRLNDVTREKLERIASRYFAATRKRLVVTGGTRTPERQARLMFEKLAHGEDIIALYEHKAAATEVRDAYRDGVSKKVKKPALVKIIKGIIDAQVARGVYVSKHLKSGAVDVRSRDMTPPREEAFRAAVKEEPGVLLLDERHSAEPHLHLSL